ACAMNLRRCVIRASAGVRPSDRAAEPCLTATHGDTSVATSSAVPASSARPARAARSRDGSVEITERGNRGGEARLVAADDSRTDADNHTESAAPVVFNCWGDDQLAAKPGDAEKLQTCGRGSRRDPRYPGACIPLEPEIGGQNPIAGGAVFEREIDCSRIPTLRVATEVIGRTVDASTLDGHAARFGVEEVHTRTYDPAIGYPEE